MSKTITHSGNKSHVFNLTFFSFFIYSIKVNAKFREHVMHGSLERAQEQVKLGAIMSEVESHTGRSALHKVRTWVKGRWY